MERISRTAHQRERPPPCFAVSLPGRGGEGAKRWRGGSAQCFASQAGHCRRAPQLGESGGHTGTRSPCALSCVEMHPYPDGVYSDPRPFCWGGDAGSGLLKHPGVPMPGAAVLRSVRARRLARLGCEPSEANGTSNPAAQSRKLCNTSARSGPRPVCACSSAAKDRAVPARVPPRTGVGAVRTGGARSPGAPPTGLGDGVWRRSRLLGNPWPHRYEVGGGRTLETHPTEAIFGTAARCGEGANRPRPRAWHAVVHRVFQVSR